MHGRIDTLRFERMDYDDLLDATVVYGIQLPHLTPKLMLQVEPEFITLWLVYARARMLLPCSRAVIVLGYSFGQRSDGFDDRYSFDFLVSLLKHNPRPVFVVSPTPYDLAAILRDTLRSHSVFGIALRWELFSGAVLAHANPVNVMGMQWSNVNADRIMRSYEAAVDAA